MREVLDAKELEEYLDTKTTLTLTIREINKITTYILLTTQSRKRNIETWDELAKEEDEDGNPIYKNAKSNADFWREMDKEIDTIREKLDRRCLSPAD